MKNRLGEKYITNQGYNVEIIKYYNYYCVDVKFDNNHIISSSMTSIKKGFIKNPYHPTILGIGYIGVGKYKVSKNRTHSKPYSVWVGILRRCYNEKEREKSPSYKNCTVAEEWHNFQNFAKWYDENYIEDFHLDKDILVKGNKIYSSETCCFVTQEINNLFTKYKKCRGDLPIGVRKSGNRYQSIVGMGKKSKPLGTFNTPQEAFQAYKTAKEQYIKEVADKWKDQIDPRVYEAMYNYKVEITD